MKVIEADRCMYLRTVRGEIQIPSLSNSSLAMRSSPQERLLKAISRISRLSSIGTGGRPGRDFQSQNRRNPAPCQPLKVFGVLFTRASLPAKPRESGSEGPLGPGFVLFFGENSWRYLRRTRHWWKFSRVDARTLNAFLAMRPGRRKSDQKPMRNRSVVERFGARRRERVITSSCCLRRRFSAMMAFAPPGPRSFAAVVSWWMKRMTMSFMLPQVRVSR